jgi:two-component system sensor histidine kinase KdpD
MPAELSPEVFPGVTRSLETITSAQPDGWVAERRGFEAFVSVPVTVAKHRLFGMLCGASTQPREVSETVVSMFESLAGIISEHVVRLHLEAIEARALAAESQLHQERDLLEVLLADAERVKNELTAVGNHELRTPITLIAGSAKLLQRANDRLSREERAELLETIIQQTQKMQNMVENLAFEDETPSVDRRASTDVRSDAEAILDWLQRAGVSPSRFRLDVPSGMFVQIERDILRSVLFNLVDNATKFSPPSSLVMVGAKRAGGYIEISIANGGHIEQDDRKRIFDPFLQLDASNTRATGGLGLGLHVAQKMLEAYGGTIEVENVDAETITFTVVLTAARNGSDP